MRKLLLILTIILLLTQYANAERWRGLIASVAALEALKVETQTQVIKVIKPEEYKTVCNDGVCKRVPVSTPTVSKGRTRFFRRR